MKHSTSHYPRWIATLSLTLIGLFVLLPNPVKAKPKHNINLLYFQAIGQDNAVLLKWATATEFDTLGFILRRADNKVGPYEDLDEIGFIPGEGGGVIGAAYEATDEMNVVNGQTYWYILVQIDLLGGESPTDPISVTAGLEPELDIINYIPVMVDK